MIFHLYRWHICCLFWCLFLAVRLQYPCWAWISWHWVVCSYPAGVLPPAVFPQRSDATTSLRSVSCRVCTKLYEVSCPAKNAGLEICTNNLEGKKRKKKRPFLSWMCSCADPSLRSAEPKTCPSAPFSDDATKRLQGNSWVSFYTTVFYSLIFAYFCKAVPENSCR